MNKFTFISCLLIVFSKQCITRNTTITLGVLYNEENSILETAFKSSVDVAKLQLLAGSGVQLDVVSRIVPLYDSFETQHFVCDLLSNGVTGVFGPPAGDTAPIVQSICDFKEIPHIQTRWDIKQKRELCQINLHPHPNTLVQALGDLITAMDWKDFTIIYENNDSLMRVTNILKFLSTNYPIRIRQLSQGPNYREELTEIKDSGETRILLDCSFTILNEVLTQAQQVDLMGSKHMFIIASLDMHTLDLDPFKYSGTNITGMRLVNPLDSEFKNTVSQWTNNLSPVEPNDEIVLPEKIPLESALIYDAVQLFITSVYSLSKDFGINQIPTPCNSSISWKHGFTLINHMKMIKDFKGLTGKIKFDQEGFRTDIELELIDLTRNGLRLRGTWNKRTGINIPYSIPPGTDKTPKNDQLDLKNMTFVVITALTEPYCFTKKSVSKLEGNDRYEGYAIDLIKELSDLNGFNYTISIQEDKMSGHFDEKTKKWSGMIGEIINGNADLAIADMSITRQREHDVDFTSPFMNLGISILYKKSTKSAPDLFSFLSPFSSFVWLLVITAYCGVSIMLFVMARISPYEWTNPYPCIEEPEYLENQFTLSNAFWFTIGSLMQQGSDFAPIAVSTRLLASMWWFFTLIMVSSYTANLAAFLTIESATEPFKNVEELVNQNKISYGMKEKGTTEEYFKESSNPVYKKVYETVSRNPSRYTSSNEEGSQKAIKEDYAYFMESTSIEYTIERECTLTQVGGLLDSKGYGIAMKKNANFRNALSASILSLQEQGKLTALKNKWWKEKNGGGVCQDKNNEASELSMKNVGGVFIVLCIGVGVAGILALIDMFWTLWTTTNKEKVSFKKELKDEIKFIAKCRGSTKPARKKKNSSSRISNGTASLRF